MEAATLEVSKRLASYEKEEVQLQERRKNLKTKQKKLDKQHNEVHIYSSFQYNPANQLQG